MTIIFNNYYLWLYYLCQLILVCQIFILHTVLSLFFWRLFISIIIYLAYLFWQCFRLDSMRLLTNFITSIYFLTSLIWLTIYVHSYWLLNLLFYTLTVVGFVVFKNINFVSILFIHFKYRFICLFIELISLFNHY